MTARKILKGALTQLPIELYELIVRGASRRPLPPVAFTSRDHFLHPGARAEWWYFTSILTTPTREAPVGLEVTFFRVKTLVDSVIVHVAVTDVERQRFFFTGMVLPVRLPLGADHRSVIGLGSNRLGFDEAAGSFSIDARLRNIGLSLACTGGSLMPQGPGGVQEMQNSPGDASYYFTLPDMTCKGSLVVNGERLQVSGRTWHDHQWGNFNVVGLKWDWFSLRFDADDIYVMLFNFDRRGTAYGAGNIYRHGQTMRIERFEVRARDTFKDAHGIAYPIDWELHIFDSADAGAPFMTVRVQPMLAGQALSSLVMPDYWEGLCTARGEVVKPIDQGGAPFLEAKSLQGFAYVELTGYSSRETA
ncbi:MAG: lipocalin-like domain-containing protein, partial [Candidatus Cryosericum sp.]